MATRTPDLYRVKVKQPLQNQQEPPQVVDSTSEPLGQFGPIVQAMGHKGPKSQAVPGTFSLALGKWLRDVRRQIGFTAEELSATSALPAQFIDAVEAGRVELSVRSLCSISQSLGLKATISLQIPECNDGEPADR